MDYSFIALFPHTTLRDGAYVDGRPRHKKQLLNHSSSIMFREGLWRRSLFGLVYTFNRLPQHVIDSESVSDFQSYLTQFLKTHCAASTLNWQFMFDAEENVLREARYWNG